MTVEAGIYLLRDIGCIHSREFEVHSWLFTWAKNIQICYVIRVQPGRVRTDAHTKGLLESLAPEDRSSDFFLAGRSAGVKVIDLAIYGDSALLLASNFRITTQDVDAVIEGDQGTVTRWAEEVAGTRNWPRLPVGAGIRLTCLCAESGYSR
jgi:hypothetical protein